MQVLKQETNIFYKKTALMIFEFYVFFVDNY